MPRLPKAAIDSGEFDTDLDDDDDEWQAIHLVAGWLQEFCDTTTEMLLEQPFNYLLKA